MIDVKLLDSAGSDLSIVNDAKVSFDEESEVLGEKEVGLLNFLARGCKAKDWEILRDTLIDCDISNSEEVEDLMNYLRKMPPHWTPFAQTFLKMQIEMPIVVARQIMKHTTGFVYNEVSRRYRTHDIQLFPNELRLKADNVKQGSSDNILKQEPLVKVQNECGEYIYLNRHEIKQANLDMYNKLLDEKVAPESARFELPQSMMVKVRVSGNLYSFASMYNQRIDPHAQKETREVAKGIAKCIPTEFEHAWKVLTE